MRGVYLAVIVLWHILFWKRILSANSHWNRMYIETIMLIMALSSNFVEQPSQKLPFAVDSMLVVAPE